MKILFVMDNLKKLDQPWDTSLCLARELMSRGHTCFTADLSSLKGHSTKATATIRALVQTQKKTIPNQFSVFTTGPAQKSNLRKFQLIMIRKDPPVNASYLGMTYTLQSAAKYVAIANHPVGIRSTNEKTGILNFPDWIPETIVTNSPSALLDFQKRIGATIVIKPLDNKGGAGIFLLKPNQNNAQSLLAEATNHSATPVMGQKFLPAKDIEKRLLVINGEILAAFEKRSPKHDFRANLGLAGTFHPTGITSKEKALVKAMKTYLVANGLNFVGLDVKGGRLIDFNVTSPAGITECELMYSRLGASKVWARSLEALARKRYSQNSQLKALEVFQR